ncbi:MAG: class I SAM-dependent methyltransferase [Chthoniobacter sp.]|uniref:class I SAM-dependent methyltransferase n=1 Tax=Chthoniobacter sp. TaxID=2510640 RepID=UPI0032AB9535
MRNYWSVFVNTLTLGKEGQSFLGAGWVEGLLRLAPASYRRQMALTVLSWSPHYFYRGMNPEYSRLSHAEFTAREFERNKSTREKLCAAVLRPSLGSDQVVLDYGCGPGFLARSVSPHVRQVYAVDLSAGVIECARILNGAPNITFLPTAQLDEIPDAAVDLVYSFAVIQHVTDAVFREILATMLRKLKPGGQLLIHIVLDDAHWRREEDWKGDRSVTGRLRLKYALNCFRRTAADVTGMLESAGCREIVIRPMQEWCPEPFDDVCTQHLVSALK